MAKKTEHTHASTRVSLAPLSVDEALSALLKTPPPKAKTKATAWQAGTKRMGKGKRKGC